jgi:hypothetical protein
MAVSGVSTLAVGAAGAGTLLLWSGITGAGVLSNLKGLLHGNPPSSADANAIGTPTGGTDSTTPSTGVAGPGGTATVDGIAVASWLAPLIAYAKSHGWTGTLTSGYRSAADQARVCATGVQPCAAPGTSHHQGLAYPDGAIDVTPRYSGPQSFVAIVRGSGLQGATEIQAAGAKDPVHISIVGSHRPGEGTY